MYCIKSLIEILFIITMAETTLFGLRAFLLVAK